MNENSERRAALYLIGAALNTATLWMMLGVALLNALQAAMW